MKLGEVVVVHIEYLNTTKFYYILKKNKKVLHITHLTDGAGEFSLTLFPCLQVFVRLWKPHFDSFPRS